MSVGLFSARGFAVCLGFAALAAGCAGLKHPAGGAGGSSGAAGSGTLPVTLGSSTAS